MITLKNVSKYYRSSSGITTGLRKINLEFHKGEFVAITGESGSGKSTMLNVLSGSDTYEEGEMYLYGHPTSGYGKSEWELYRRDYISFIYQNYNLIDSYSAIDNVESALLMKGISKKERREKALKYLEITGLSEYADHKGSELSSGQKQRLSIARALAKETDIIVADEPTGNLDTENGNAVIKLLHELSKDKLVIIVTHNFEQVEEYATRKVRLYGGEVAEDIMLNGNERITEEEEVDLTKEPFKDSPLFMTKKQLYARMKELKENKKAYKAKKRADFKQRFGIAWRFVCQNKTAQPRRNALIFAFFMCVMFSFFVFFGNLISSVDDASAKIYSTAGFYNGALNRIEIAKLDGTVTTKEDLDKILKLDYVMYGDTFDTIHDINYFMYKNDDYEIKYIKPVDERIPQSEELVFLDRTKFMMSEQCIEESQLKKGRMPEAANEVVLSSKDAKLLGKTVRMYFNHGSRWDEDMYIAMDMTVVGITNEKKAQAYFDTDFCTQVSVGFEGIDEYLYVRKNEWGKTGVDNVRADLFDEKDRHVPRYEESESWWNRYGGASKMTERIFIVDDTLKINQVMLSQAFYNDFGVQSNVGFTPYSIYKDILIRADVNGKYVLKTADIFGDPTISSKHVVSISRQLYEKIFATKLDGNNQMCVYIEDYAYTDRVVEAIEKLGNYDAISVYKAGVTDYDADKVSEKLQAVLISIGAVVVVFVLGNFLLFMMMKLKKGDFIILKALGLEQKVASDINYLDMYSNVVAATTVVLILSFIIGLCGVTYIQNIMKYYTLPFIILLYVMGLVMSYLVAGRFNRFIQKNDKITSLKEN